ncbi:MAG: gliding motility-associated C-terminal domain-containing protein [Bacteroidales bacterium]|nr:gliding motility-associated C-terminal domain-containing protein [Bacteroidales bacterium]
MKNLIRTSARIYFAAFILLLAGATAQAQSLQTPAVDSISIDATHPVMSWFPNIDNTGGYVIVKRVNNAGIFIWQRIDTVVGINQTTYTDFSADACVAPQWYRIYATSASSLPDSPWSDTLRTLFLEQPFFDICANTVQLQWNSYLNMVNTLGGYRVFASENGGSFAQIGQTAADVTQFAHTNLSAGTLYAYKIQAFNQDGTRTSTSCQRSIMSRTYPKPEFVYLKYATVEDNDHIKIAWLTDDAPISKYNVLRSLDGAAYDTISRISDLTTYAPSQFYNDTSADFNSRSYYYKINVCDSCGFTRQVAVNFAQTIFLSGGPALSGFVNELQWNPYQEWPLGVEKYEIYRKVDGAPNPAGALATVPGSQTDYQDNVAGFSDFKGQFSYYVKAIENVGDNGYESTVDNSISNEIIISRESRILVPNAIIAGGTPPDDEFKPVVQFIEQEEYQLIIFNKWGQQLFASREISEGWNGTFNGEWVPADTYVYLIKYKDATGALAEKRGTVTVIR